MQRLVHNILLFGEAGSGKSSVVNMIIGKDLANTSSDPTGCTFRHQDYLASFDDYSCNIYDTAGLNEGDQGRVPHWKAIGELYTLIRKLDGVTLLICCVRGRIKENTHANWTLFHDVICNRQVPVILVMTGLEQEDDWDSDARLDRIRHSFGVYNMKPKDVAVVVAIRGLENEYLDMYEKSQKRLRNLISTHRRPWSADKETWFRDIYIRAYNTAFVLSWFGVGTKVEFGQEMKGLVQDFAGQTRMKGGELSKLEETLLSAERKIAKRETAFTTKVLEFVKRKDDATPAKWNITSRSHNKDESEQQETSAAAEGGQERELRPSLQAEENELQTWARWANADEESKMVHEENIDGDSVKEWQSQGSVDLMALRSFSQEMKGPIRDFVGQTQMKEEESRKLQATLLAAEQEIAKQETGFTAKVLEFMKRKDDATLAKRNITSRSNTKDGSEQWGIPAADGGQERESLQVEKNEINTDEEKSKNVYGASAVVHAPGNLKVHETNDWDSVKGGQSQGSDALPTAGRGREKGMLSQAMKKGKRFARTGLKGIFLSKDKEPESKKSGKYSAPNIWGASPVPSGSRNTDQENKPTQLGLETSATVADFDDSGK